MDRLRGEEHVFHLHGDGLLALLFQVEAFRGPALVHQGARFIADDKGLSLGIRLWDDPVQGAAQMVDAAGPFEDGDRGAELGKPEGPVRAGGRVLDRHRVDGFLGFGVGRPFRPDDAAGLRAREREQADNKADSKRFRGHGHRFLVSKAKDGKKIPSLKRFDAFCVLKYAKIRLTCLFCL